MAMRTAVLVGLDPGGAKAFGWCVVDNGPTLPLRIRASGVANDAAAAMYSIDQACAGSKLAAAGIDAPMFWTPSGKRQVDVLVRRAICELGASSGTVSHVNSLRGACLVQGMVVAMLLRQRNSKLPVTEAHPKAALWLLGEATKRRKAARVTAASLSGYFHVGRPKPATEHERDAALAALGAWAMVHRAAGWENISRRDRDALPLLAAPLGYWMPKTA
jgi:predicted nuclease with RNAse H fold